MSVENGFTGKPGAGELGPGEPGLVPSRPQNEVARALPRTKAAPGDLDWAHPRLTLGQVPLDVVRREQALDAIEGMVESGRGGAVFTSGLDQVVTAGVHPGVRAACARAELAVAGGRALVWASRLQGAPLPEAISGAGLLDGLMALAGRRSWRVFIIGDHPEVMEAAAARLERRHRARVVGACSPDEAVRGILRANPQLVLVALGTPGQELLIDRIKERVRPSVLVGLGACPQLTTARWRGRWLKGVPRFLFILIRVLFARRRAPCPPRNSVSGRRGTGPRAP